MMIFKERPSLAVRAVRRIWLGVVSMLVALATPVLAASFLDVAPGSWAYDHIEAIAQAGITTGCGNGNFCPAQIVDRQQMAAFLVRAMEGEPAGDCVSPPFSDIPAGHAFCRYIKRLYELGVTTGCGNGNYCPLQAVDRQQAAALLVRAVEGEPLENCVSAPFTDVPASHPFCRHIKRLHELGVTSGCGGGRYCPGQPLNREQMAVFLARAFNLLGSSAVTAGALSTPYPTIENISVVWAYTGDTNANSAVNVRYRKSGDSAWLNGMPLRNVPPASTQGFSWTNRHAGSIFNLQPATTYEIELTLTDPDGGGTIRTTSATTRPIPVPMANAPLKNATPATLSSVLASAQPGDKIVLGAGSYSGFQINVSGQAGKPIAISGQAGAHITGEISIFSRSHIYLENLNLTGRIRFNGSDNISVVRSTIQASANNEGHGIITYTRAENAYIADNIITGTTVWADASMGNSGNNLGEGILVTGPGHVVMNNRVTNFRDCISLLEDSGADEQVSIDILNNDIRQCGDDGVEADFCSNNCRIMRNRLTDVFVALSSQPGLGGPTYFIRNAAYNVAHIPFKLYRTSYGDVVLHNTVVKSGDGFGVYAGVPVYRATIANNLFIGGPGGTYGGYSNGSGRVIDFTYLDTASSSIDYQAYGSTVGTFSGKIGSTSFSDVAQLNANTPEKHSLQTDLNAFAASVAFPSSPTSIHSPVDLRLKSGSPPMDKALPIANINDGYAGAAPDIGAYETGTALPVYGPR